VNSSIYQFIASAPRGLADLLARELTAFGATQVRERSTGVAFEGALEVAYRACLESRTANRILLLLGERDVASAEDFYTFGRSIDWTAHIGPGATIACDFSGKHPSITHTHFGALKLKDAIVDFLRERSGQRPDVARDQPSVRVHAHARGTKVTLAIDLSGDSLHRRGYRGPAGEAPLKENVAAGILLRAGWPELAAAGAELFDPLCGSGTFVIEAALIAADKAPGLTRDYFGFLGWRGHDPALWSRVREQAISRVRMRDTSAGERASDESPSAIRGADQDAHAIRAARINAERAGVADWASFAIAPLADAAPLTPARGAAPEAAASPTTATSREPIASSAAPAIGEAIADESARTLPPGLIVTNPPYGVRLEDREAALRIHKELGQVLRDRFKGWQAAVLTGAPDLGLELGVRAYRTHTMWNGPLECRLLRLKVERESYRERAEPGRLHFDAELKDSPGSKMFGNRLAKNRKRLAKWAKSNGISCFRLYDADMPEYSFAIDTYRTADDGLEWLYVQEYAAPEDIAADAVRRRRGEAFAALTDVTGVPHERIRVRTRRRQSEGAQYRKVDEQSRFHTVEEGGLRFQVNFEDYLDTGLFLDHRMTRARLRDAAKGKHFLNLFGYTGSATVYAASGGAAATTTVDLSRTYLDWARRNLELNGLGTRHHVYVQSDCRAWLAQAAMRGERFELIFLDPPTFSNSKRMEGVLDVRRDHVALIDECARVLAPGGLLLFSTNAQKFKLDAAVAERYNVRDISRETLPLDFERNARIHSCYELTRAAEPAASGR
jgi:23S rRNA (guanine2445-N2)-methyltransferase / 23S rRNA (guanine2069-N7)-methyltransferase